MYKYLETMPNSVKKAYQRPIITQHPIPIPYLMDGNVSNVDGGTGMTIGGGGTGPARGKSYDPWDSDGQDRGDSWSD